MPLANLAIDASRMTVRQRTGTENYSIEIIQAIAALPDAPPITLYTRKGQELPALPGTTIKASGPARLWTHIGLSRAMLRDRPDALFVPSHVIPLAHPKASVVTVHDLGYLHEPEAHPRRHRLMLDRTTRWNARAAARIIAISAQTRDDLVNHYGVDPTCVAVVHHGLNHARFRRHAQEEVDVALAQYDIRSPYVLFVSTVQPRKNVVRLVEAFESLANRDLTLVIAGKSGWLSTDIENRIENSSAAGRVQRVGHVADSDLPMLYSGASAFVLPSLFEGFGMGVLEAMACGAPVVTSHSGSLAEVAGDAAVLVDPYSVDSIADGIRQALDPQEAGNLRTSGFQRASEFSWPVAARQTLTVIEEAFDGS